MALGFVGDILGINQVQDASAQAASMAQFDPASITSGLGSVSFDKENNSFSTSLSPDMQALQDQLLGLSSTKLGEASAFDYEGTSKNISSRLRDLAAPQEAAQRKSLESRLYQQGQLTSTEGSERFGSLLDSQALAEALRNLQGYQEANTVQSNTFNQGMQAIGGAQAIDQTAMGLLDRSIAAGNSSSAAGAAAGQFLMSGAQATSDFWNSIIGGGVQGYMSQPSGAPAA